MQHHVAWLFTWSQFPFLELVQSDILEERSRQKNPVMLTELPLPEAFQVVAPRIEQTIVFLVVPCRFALRAAVIAHRLDDKLAIFADDDRGVPHGIDS